MSREDLPAIGDTIFDIVFGFFNTFISIFTGGAITDFLGGYSDLEGFWEDNEAWLITELINGFDNVLGLTQDIWVDTIGKSRAGLMDVLDLSNYIEQQFEAFYNESKELADTISVSLDRDHEREVATGEEMVDFAMQRILQSQLSLEAFSTEYYEALLESDSNASDRLITVSEQSMAFVRDYLAADRDIIESLANADSTEAAAAILATAEEGARFVNEWFLETVVKPISYGETMAWAMTEANTVDIEQTLEDIADLTVKWHKLQLSMMEDHVIVPGGTPIPGDEE